MGKKSPDAPAPRDYYAESRDTLQAQVDLAPDLYAAEAEYRPKYDALEMQQAEALLLGQGGLLDILDRAGPRMDSLENDALSRKRASELEQLKQYGAEAVQAFDAIDPQNAKIKKLLSEAAISDLEMGGELDPATLRQVTQGARGESAVSGFGYDPMSFAKEVGAVGREAESRKMTRRGFAQSVVAQNAATGLDPTVFLFNKPSNTATSAGLLSGTQAFQGAPGLFSINNGYASDLYNTNYNAQAAANIAGANNSASLLGSVIGLGGSLGAASILRKR